MFPFSSTNSPNPPFYEYYYSIERVGCLLKDKLEKDIKYLNENFPISNKPSITIFFENPFENCFENATFFENSTINYEKWSKFDCKDFFSISKCLTRLRAKTAKGFWKIGSALKECEGTKDEPARELQKCMFKCFYEKLEIFDGTYFNTTKAEIWYEENMPSIFGKLYKNTVKMCQDFLIAESGKDISYDCEYFYKFFSCHSYTSNFEFIKMFV